MQTFLRWACLLPFFLWISCGEGEREKLIDEAPLISKVYQDSTGRSIELPRAPQRFLSLTPSITETIFAIGAEGKLIGRSMACDFPAEVGEWAEVGFDENGIDLPLVAELNPDLILLAEESFSEEHIRLLDQSGWPYFLFRYEDLEAVYQSIRDVGVLMGAEKKADQIADSLMALEARILDSTEIQIKYPTVMLVNDRPLQAAGGVGLWHEMIEKAGGENIFSEAPSALVSVTEDHILTGKPEYLMLVSDNDQAYANLVEFHPRLYNLPAAARDQVFLLPPDWIFRPGPRILQGLLQLTLSLHSPLVPALFIEGQAL